MMQRLGALLREQWTIDSLTQTLPRFHLQVCSRADSTSTSRSGAILDKMCVNFTVMVLE